jgi:hypothetical protein
MMDYRKLESLVYAQGFVDSYINEYIAENTPDADAQRIEHMAQLLNMWLRVSVGVDELRKESSDLNSMILNARTALQ